MITSNQIKALTEEETTYLVACFHDEWYHQGMKYPFKFNFIKSWRNDAVQYTLNKYSNYLSEDKRHIILDILNKLEQNR